MLVAQLAQLLVRHVLGDQATALKARAAERLLRTQRVAILEDGNLMAADFETF